MKKMIYFTVVALMSAATIHAQQRSGGPVGTAGFSLSVPLERDVVKGLPYSAEMETDFVQTLADGNRIVRRTTGRVYRDSQGRVRREEDRPSGTPAISIVDAVARLSYSLDPARRTARETPNGPLFQLSNAAAALQKVYGEKVAESGAGSGRGAPTAVAAPTGAGDVLDVLLNGAAAQVVVARGGGFIVKKPGDGGKDSGEERLPDRVIEGVLASGIRRTTTIAAGAIGNEQPITIVSEEWRSPDLQVLVLTDRVDPQTGRSTYRLLRINRAEPDSSLFQVPADYAVQRAPGLGGRGGRGTPGEK